MRFSNIQEFPADAVITSYTFLISSPCRAAKVIASEAMAFAAKQGLDIRKVYEVITASAGNSWMFENRMPHVLDGDYTPRSAVEIFVKDLGIIQDMARNARFPVPVAAAALQMFLMTAAAGMGRDDDASVARMYAKVTGTKLPGEK